MTRLVSLFGGTVNSTHWAEQSAHQYRKLWNTGITKTLRTSGVRGALAGLQSRQSTTRLYAVSILAQCQNMFVNGFEF